MSYGFHEKADSVCARLSRGNSARLSAQIGMADLARAQRAVRFADAGAQMTHRARRDTVRLQDFEAASPRVFESATRVVKHDQCRRMRQRKMCRTDAAMRSRDDDLPTHFFRNCTDAVDEKCLHVAHDQSMCFS